MESFEGEIDVLNMVNANSKRALEKANNEERINAYFVATDRAVQDSIKRTDSRIENNNFINERADTLLKKRKAQVAALILAGAAFVGGMAYAGSRIAAQQDISKATSIVMDEAKNDLLNLMTYTCGGSFTYTEFDNIGNMATFLSANDYSKLNVTSIEDVYAYRKILPADEFEDFIRGMQYTNDEGTFNYVSFRQYLNINGFSEEREFENRAQAILLNAYRDGNLTSKYDTVGKGGK